jgi:hypothetical protein
MMLLCRDLTNSKTKEELGSNDAIESQAVGAAYVENFGLKVFANADNEDRKGLANRTTAKKFLAAANFLELLKVFVKSNNAELVSLVLLSLHHACLLTIGDSTT